jgi:hypothetical protein
VEVRELFDEIFNLFEDNIALLKDSFSDQQRKLLPILWVKPVGSTAAVFTKMPSLEKKKIFPRKTCGIYVAGPAVH